MVERLDRRDHPGLEAGLGLAREAHDVVTGRHLPRAGHAIAYPGDYWSISETGGVFQRGARRFR